MLPGYGDNAILAKVRAMYGRRLLPKDYEQLLTKKTVGEVAAYLKAETGYAGCLQEVREELIHRQQLENLIHRRTLDVYTRLLKYARKDTLFLRLYVMQNEIEQLLTAIRMLGAGNIDRYIVSLPVYLARLLSFDLFAVARIQSFDDLLAVVEHSPYSRILAEFRPISSGQRADIAACEAALLTHYYRTALAHTDREYRGAAREDLRRLLLHQVNLHNVSVICRLRRYRNAPRDLIRPLILQVEGMDKGLVTRLLDAPDMAATAKILTQSASVRKHVSADWRQSVWQLTGRQMQVRQEVSQRIFRFSTHPAVVVLCYMTLLEIEQDNIVHIIEGIRYGVDAGQIRELVCM